MAAVPLLHSPSSLIEIEAMIEHAPLTVKVLLNAFDNCRRSCNPQSRHNHGSHQLHELGCTDGG
jgi:hypothetical protein